MKICIEQRTLLKKREKYLCSMKFKYKIIGQTFTTLEH